MFYLNVCKHTGAEAVWSVLLAWICSHLVSCFHLLHRSNRSPALH